jgi:hypothetical protein
MPADRLLFDARIPSRSGYRRRGRILTTALAVLVALSACTSGSPATKSTERGDTAGALPDEERARLGSPGAAASLSSLTGLGQLEQLFDAHQDVPRLILLLSPT